MFPFLRSFQISPWFPNAFTLEAERLLVFFFFFCISSPLGPKCEICVQVNSLYPCWEPRVSTGHYDRQVWAPWFASCCSCGKFLLQSKQFLFFQVDMIKCRIIAGLTGTESHPQEPTGAHSASLAWKFWKRYSGINSLLNINSGVETPLSRGLSSPVIPHLDWELVNKNIAMGLMAKQFFQNQLQAQMLSELFPLEQWEFWWAWRSGLTASPRQPAHRKASESFSLMREPQMSNRKNNQVRISSCLFSPVCTHLWFPGQ